MFLLGTLAFLDSFLNYGQIFRMVNSIFFMMLALGVLIRTRLMASKGRMEKLIERSENLEKQKSYLNMPEKIEENKPQLMQ
jgi:hypothetical protein